MPFSRATKQNPCPVCGKPDWCLASTDGELAICPRTPEGSIRCVDTPEGGFAGYLHKVAEHAEPRRHEHRPRKEHRYTIDAKRIAHECYARLDPVRLAEFACELGVSTASLESLMVGWHEPKQAYTFPMRDGLENIIGIRTRHADGSKRAITGSRAGLFVPDLLPRGSLYICEGPTDTAAMLTLGLAAIGRPSCMGSHSQVIEFLASRRHMDVIIVADRDKEDKFGKRPGREGAVRLREAIGVGRIVEPPDCVKDIRERVKEVLEIMEDCDAGAL